MRTRARAAAALTLPAFILGAAAPPEAAATERPADRVQRTMGSRVYYVDPVTGNDRASGRSRQQALRTLAQVGRLDLRPGDRVRLRGGVAHVGALTVQQSGSARRPIVLDTYGTSERAVIARSGCVTVDGGHWRISGILARNCGSAGFRISGDDVTLQDVEATRNVAGVVIERGAAHAVVRDSRLHHNNRMAPGTPGADDDYGAEGIVVSGTDAVIAHNVIEGHHAPSPDYGQDGAAIEVYGATGTRIYRNVARDNLAFVELGDSSTDDTRVAYNMVTSSTPSASFLITRGASTFGPVKRTTAVHNSVQLSGAGSIGVSCHPNCSPGILRIGSNVIDAPDVGYAEAPDGSLADISLGYNVYAVPDDGWLGLRTTDTDIRSESPFAPETLDLDLAAGSPAVDLGGPSWATDLRGSPAPVDGDGDGDVGADAGALELQTARFRTMSDDRSRQQDTLRAARPAEPRVTLLIPALNEASNLAEVLPRLPPDVHEVILVDGGSVDDTVAVTRRLRPDAHIVEQTRTGKGNAVAVGLAAATGDIIVMFDADGSADPREIPRFVQALVDGADFAKGSRFVEDGGSVDITGIRKVGNDFLHRNANLLFGTHFTDLCYGYNAFWADIVDILDLPDPELPMLPSEAMRWGDGFEVETLIICRVAASGLRVVEVPSVELERAHGASNLHAVRDGFRVLRTIYAEGERGSRLTHLAHLPAADTGQTEGLHPSPDGVVS